jgi:hypothetical protein
MSLWIPAAATAGAALLGHEEAEKQRKDAKNALKRAEAEFSSIKVPELSDQKLILEQLMSAGMLNPEMEQALTLQDSAFDSVSTDPRLKQAQLQALSKFMEINEQGGLSLQDQANLNKIQGQLRQQEKGNRDAILQNMAQRGVSGSGFELAAQLSNNQAVSDRASQEGLDIAALAQQRALDALMNQNQVASQMRNQDFGEQSSKAQAQDAINKFNTANRQDVQHRNVSTMNQSQATNLQNKQRVMDSNVALRNEQQQYNKELMQKQFDNKYKIAAGKSGILQNQSQLSQNHADATRKLYGDIISAGANAYAAYNKK